MSGTSADCGDLIAIVGLACRFPGARDVDEFWRNLREGVESVRFFSEAELAAAGVGGALLKRPDYVRAGAVLDGADRFDAGFFGYPPREAELLDPQQRIFLECAWSALEHAGWDPSAMPGATGVFAGAGLNTYLLRQIAPNAAAVESAGDFSVLIANDKDFLATRVAYKLNLRGPAVGVQTACSTSLVAVHLAGQSLLAGECDAAVAGGVSLRFPQVAGYLHREGMILSPDGHCRAFDARAAGTVGGSGAGAVVLKRLADALADGDTVHAVIRGSAINNDGSGKVGYTAPSAEGQEAVVAEALAVAGVEPDSIGYVEAHGTGTSLGDPVEVEALTRAFRRGTQRRGFCALGSVKTNFGHLDAAAGVAGLIKAVLALAHREIPASLHFEAANPAIDFARSPFRVAARREAWPAGAAPRRAGVSSFGIGGTNAHVVLEEAPAAAPRAGDGRPQLLVLSARTEAALGRAAENLARRLEEDPPPLADVAFTLALGRKAFARRRFVVARDLREAVSRLRGAAEDVPADAEREKLARIGREWIAGGAADWDGLFGGRGLRRVPLPAYPFEGERYWIESAPPRKPDLADWFYLPDWRTLPTSQASGASGLGVTRPATTGAGGWMVVGDGLGPVIAARLRREGAKVIEESGRRYREAFERARAEGIRPATLIHTGHAGETGAEALADLWALIRALGSAEPAPGTRLVVAADGIGRLPGEKPGRADLALLLGPIRVLPREFPGVSARALDLAPGDEGAIEGLLREARRDGPESLVALRGNRAWAAAASSARLEAGEAALRDRGVYLITGGLGGIGAVLALDLARRCRARLILTGRTPLPAQGGGGPAGERLRRIAAIEAAGGEVFTGCADASDEAAMRRVLAEAAARFGPIHGVIHAAGLPGGGALARREAAETAAVLAPKVGGAQALERIFRGQPLDFLVLMSSLSAQLGEFGQADYAAANSFLDAFAEEQRAAGVPAVAIAWDAWRDSGMAARQADLPGLAEWAAARRPFRIADEEGVELFHRAVAAGVPRVIISTRDLAGRLAEAAPPAQAASGSTGSTARPRPLTSAYSAPEGETERGLAAIWEELIGVAPVGREDDFFDLGGHSLLATQVLARVRSRWGAGLGLPAFFQAPTVAELARTIDAGRPDGADEPLLAPVPRTGQLPLSHQQEALWLLDRMEGRSAQMNELGAQTIRGPLDAGLLRRSLEEVVRRHEALRTRFVEAGGRPAQEIAAEAAFGFDSVDLSSAKAETRDGAIRRIAAELAAKPFDLARGPLLRATLVRCGARHHVVLVAVHHIVFDGWSAGVFFREMVAAYTALAEGRQPELPALPLQYADYAAWQRAALRGPRREKLAAYWKERLRGPLPVLALPTDHPRPAAPSYRGLKQRVELGAGPTSQLAELGRAAGAAPFAVLLAAYGALLARYTGQEDIVVGCPSANRGRSETEPLIGFFINPLPLRLDLSGSPTFTELVARVRTEALAAFEHQALPFELMVEAAQPPRHRDRHPVFQTHFIYQNSVPAPPAAPGLEIEALEFPEGPARTDLDLYLWEGPGGLAGYFIYDTALFAAPAIARLAGRWRTLIESILEGPERPLSELRLDRPASLPRLPRPAAV